ncbi:hypothetical protein BGZ97_012130 [Linnemannia gamsii]|uniref:Uncharacterized protein n=1 Tax=Linnemannia gamsii TaxID=64522 RepID=A0A9P6UM55_9FUNG|nr:hypothetical protein BGZ97_012130 [Linnemannia gamsii]
MSAATPTAATTAVATATTATMTTPTEPETETLLVLLTTLFLGVLIMTEFVLDREDEDVAKARWYFWGRVLGVITATVVSAVHGSFLSAYVLLGGQSDCIAKAVVGTILFYWVGMIVLMNRTTGPLPY